MAETTGHYHCTWWTAPHSYGEVSDPHVIVVDPPPQELSIEFFFLKFPICTHINTFFITECPKYICTASFLVDNLQSQSEFLYADC